ncbi:MAG: hypothetical protein COX57_07775 [Alphaproteobacteria bacterium CG_4_10_14_0_2_um_filter_63_37]|nr:MAG: hypothetical protein AUJ55_03930 [Proteobacteria bacterium CG1_02_64_396]PJA24518.1 MAG: hypothetical protein COX57_07775 [Alphaproteobacteria bacterium CG_4_10_14_0_2_um_filter_63_37]
MSHAQSLPPVIERLLDPSFYPHPVEHLELIQTHVSWVVLTGPYAYKVKKPVDFGFLDFSTLEKRQHFIALELTLNRRLAPDLYLEVLPVRTDPQGNLELGGDEGDRPIVEYVLKMVQFPQSHLLDRLLSENKVEPQWIDALADRVARFHQDAPTGKAIASFGAPERVRENIRQNFEQSRHLVERGRVDAAAFDAFERWSEAFFVDHDETFRQRAERGHIRECHGDLHSGNIAVWDGNLQVFDCIEFNEPFRFIDTISDLAFLVMDLRFRGRPDLAIRVLNRYLAHTGDTEALVLLPLYESYRAHVRAKVAGFMVQGGDESQGVQAARYLEYAMQVTHPRTPRIVGIFGLSGTGKSSVAASLAEAGQAIWLRSDTIRRQVAGLELTARTNSALNHNLYAADMTAKTYAELFRQAGDVVAAGLPVIVDATFLEQEGREALHGVAKRFGVPLDWVWTDLPPHLAEERIVQRSAAGADPSEATVEVYRAQRMRFDPLQNLEDRVWRQETTQPIDADALWRRIEAG